MQNDVAVFIKANSISFHISLGLNKYSLAIVRELFLNNLKCKIMDKLLQTQYFKNGTFYCKFSCQGLFIVDSLTKETASIPLLNSCGMLLSMKLSDCVEIDEIDFIPVWNDALSIYN